MICHPAVKINLGLHVLQRREDGFHNLETLFVPSRQFHDTLEIISGDDYSRTLASIKERYTPAQRSQAISPDGKLMITLCREEGVDWNPLEDLTARAYRILDQDFHLPPVKIFLEKTSPVGAGLGGGSADAAAALKALDGLFALSLGQETLARYAALLGSDCAFFLFDTPMFGCGRGEILTPFPLPALAHLRPEIIVPEGIHVSTADAYRGIVSRTPPKPLAEILRQDPTTWKEALVNDFETTVFARFPVLSALKQSLYRRGALYASLSGSGSALFGLFPA